MRRLQASGLRLQVLGCALALAAGCGDDKGAAGSGGAGGSAGAAGSVGAAGSAGVGGAGVGGAGAGGAGVGGAGAGGAGAGGAGAGGAGAGGAGAGAGTGPLTPAPPGGGQQLATTTYTLDPGQERYLCWTFRSPTDAEKAITEVAPIAGVDVHHVLLVRTSVPESRDAFECPVLIDRTWMPIWAGGAGARALALPAGVGFKVSPGTQYLVQLHLLNTSSAQVSRRAGINLRYAADSSVLQGAGLFAMGRQSLNIPAGARAFEQASECQAPASMRVFAAFPHMHQLGKWLSFFHGAQAADATEKYRKDPWSFGEQPMDPLDLQIAAGDSLRATCAWDNPRDTPVTFGESSNDEMCFFLLFYYPATRPFIGCVGG